jgi:DNA-binding NarL/FixJ family response regulator
MNTAPNAAGQADVLIIEDQTAIRQMMAAAVNTMSGFRVVGECATVHEGIRAAEAKRPAVVVLDWVLENGTGRDFLRAIRGWKVPPAVLVFSGQTSALPVREAFVHGATGFVEKTCAMTEFMAALRDVAEGRVHMGPQVARVMKTLVATGSGERVGEKVSPREGEVLRLVAEGYSSKEIATRLSISVRTVSSHRAALIQKTGKHSVAELTRHAFDVGLVEAPRGAEA